METSACDSRKGKNKTTWSFPFLSWSLSLTLSLISPWMTPGNPTVIVKERAMCDCTYNHLILNKIKKNNLLDSSGRGVQYVVAAKFR